MSPCALAARHKVTNQWLIGMVLALLLVLGEG